MNPEDPLKVMKLFLDYGQDVNALAKDGLSIMFTCLFLKENQAETIRYLLENTRVDSQIRLTDDQPGLANQGESAMDMARRMATDEYASDHDIKKQEMLEVVAMLEEVTNSLTLFFCKPKDQPQLSTVFWTEQFVLEMALARGTFLRSTPRTLARGLFRRNVTRARPFLTVRSLQFLKPKKRNIKRSISLDLEHFQK